MSEAPSEIAITPVIHWLELTLAPQEADHPVILQSLGLSIPPPRGGQCSAFLAPGGSSNKVDHCRVPFRLNATRQRWLMPPSRVEITAHQSFRNLQPWSDGHRSIEVDTAVVEVDRAVHRVTLRIPPPPSDEELLGRDR